MLYSGVTGQLLSTCIVLHRIHVAVYSSLAWLHQKSGVVTPREIYALCCIAQHIVCPPIVDDVRSNSYGLTTCLIIRKNVQRFI